MLDLKIIRLIITIGLRFLAHELLSAPWRLYPPQVKEITLGWRFRLLDQIEPLQAEFKTLLEEFDEG